MRPCENVYQKGVYMRRNGRHDAAAVIDWGVSHLQTRAIMSGTPYLSPLPPYQARRLAVSGKALSVGLCLMSLVTLLLIGGGRARLALAQSSSGILSPATGEQIGGVVLVQGTATDSAFLRYELAFWRDANPGSGWVVFAEGDQPVLNGTLAVWDTTIGRNVGSPFFPDGGYQLRLRVVRQDYNFDEYFVTALLISNDQPTPAPTSLPLATNTPRPTLAAEVTPLGGAPGALPTLTPFPTLTPRPTAGGVTGDPANSGGAGVGEAETVAAASAFDLSRFGQAFGKGVQVTFLFFAGLGVYLILRALLRGVWRFLTTNF